MHGLLAEYKGEGAAPLRQILLDRTPSSHTPLLDYSQDFWFCAKWYCAQLKLFTFSESLCFAAGPVTQFWPILFYEGNSLQVAGIAPSPFALPAFHGLLPWIRNRNRKPRLEEVAPFPPGGLKSQGENEEPEASRRLHRRGADPPFPDFLFCKTKQPLLGQVLHYSQLSPVLPSHTNPSNVFTHTWGRKTSAATTLIFTSKKVSGLHFCTSVMNKMEIWWFNSSWLPLLPPYLLEE